MNWEDPSLTRWQYMTMVKSRFRLTTVAPCCSSVFVPFGSTYVGMIRACSVCIWTLPDHWRVNHSTGNVMSVLLQRLQGLVIMWQSNPSRGIWFNHFNCCLRGLDCSTNSQGLFKNTSRSRPNSSEVMYCLTQLSSCLTQQAALRWLFFSFLWGCGST